METFITKPDIRFAIIVGIFNFVKMLFILCSAMCLRTYGFAALILAECAYIAGYFVFYFFIIRDKKGKIIKDFFLAIAPGVIIVAVIAAVCASVGDNSTLDDCGRIAAYIFALFLIVPVWRLLPGGNFKSRVSWLFSHSDIWASTEEMQISGKQKTLLKLSKILYRVMLPVSLFVLAFADMDSGEFYFIILAVVGCLIWFFNIVLISYCDATCEIRVVRYSDEEINETEKLSGNEPRGGNSVGGASGKMLSSSGVERIVKKIADRWTGRSDTSLGLSGGGSIRYNVTVQIVGSTFIEYTISGRLEGVRDSDAENAFTLLGGKMDKAAYKIKEETERELSKHTLPEGSYNITVYKGQISR